MMSRVDSEPSMRQYGAASVVMETAAEAGQENWYFWSKQTATRNDYNGSESITTVYAVKTAIGQKRYKGSSLTSI